MHWYELRVAGRGQACRGLFFHDSGEKVFEVSGREGRDMPVFLSSLILTLILLLATFVEEGSLAMRVSSRPLTLVLHLVTDKKGALAYKRKGSVLVVNMRAGMPFLGGGHGLTFPHAPGLTTWCYTVLYNRELWDKGIYLRA